MDIHLMRRAVAMTLATTAVLAGLLGTNDAGAVTALRYGVGDPVDYPTSPNPFGVAVGDLNGDGHPDLVSIDATLGNDTVTVSLADPAGGYQSPVRAAAGTNFSTIAIADVTGDGNADVVLSATNHGDGVVLVLAGDGTGGLGDPVEYSVAAGAGSGLALGDLNGDGHPDIVISDANGTTNPGVVGVLLSDGAGSFADAATYAVDANPKDVAIADLDQDGNPDLVVASYSTGTVSVLNGDGSGGFATAVSYSAGANAHPYGLTAGDFNGDGYPDVAVSQYSSATVSVLANDGAGGLGTPTNLSTGGNGFLLNVATADINGDGALDLVAIDNQPRIFYGAGDGTFGAARPTGSWGDVGIAIADLNADGRPDLVTAVQSDPGSVAVFLQVPAPTLVQAPSITHRAVIGDLVFAGNGVWNGSPTGYHYDWQRCSSGGCVETGAADTSVYFPDENDIGYQLRVAVTATNAAGASDPAYSALTTVVLAPPAVVTAPTITLTHNGTVLSGDRGTWSGDPTSYGKFWFVCDAAGDNCSYARRGSTLPITTAMVGNRVEFDVYVQGPGGSAETSVLSDPVAGVAPVNTTLPTISGTPAVGQTLTAGRGTWDAIKPVQIHYSWQRCTGTSCVRIAHATARTYTVTSADAGHPIVVRVTMSNPYGSTAAFSAATAPVQ